MYIVEHVREAVGRKSEEKGKINLFALYLGIRKHAPFLIHREAKRWNFILVASTS